ncbi:hypothetical protein Ciccas_008886 [Cichlidogyrus casuarinus]|uniref:Uncharacterized protein n=1 Tax=Cichlidogyrus casuarinus TaxID=1844966 RepID=A0ABD2PZ82_9PLAT
MKGKKAVPRSTATGDHAKQEDELNRSIEAQLEEQLVLDDDMGVDHEEEIQTEVPRRDPKLDARGLLTLNTIPAYREGTVKLWLTDMEDLSPLGRSTMPPALRSRWTIPH